MISTLSILTALLPAAQMATAFTINAPTGNVAAGQQVNVTWSFKAEDPVEATGFQLALLGAGTPPPETTNIIEATYGFEDGGSGKLVTIPSTLPTAQYVFAALDEGNEQFAPFASTQPFTINGPTLTLDTPSGAVAAGQQITITWDATNGFVADPFEIVLIGGNPEVAEDLGSFSTSAQTSAEVTIPSTTTAGQYTLQAIDSNNNAEDLLAETATFTVTA